MPGQPIAVASGTFRAGPIQIGVTAPENASSMRRIGIRADDLKRAEEERARLQTIADAGRLRRTRKARAARRIRKFCGYVCAMRALEDQSRVAYLRSVRDDADRARGKLLVAEARQVNKGMRCINVAMAKLRPGSGRRRWVCAATCSSGGGPRRGHV